jgi:hypothetical protein
MTRLPHNGKHGSRGPGWLSRFPFEVLEFPGNRKRLKESTVHYGMNRRNAEKAAIKIGATVSPLRRTGEKECVFPSGRRVRINARQKGASRNFIAAILSEM